AAPRLGCINVHASILPRWRGASPIQRAIMAGDRKSGVTIMQMDEGLDTGAILAGRAIAIDAEETGTSLAAKLAALGGNELVAALDSLARGTIEPRQQPEAGATYAAKLTRADGRLDWRESAQILERRIRALALTPGAWFEQNGERFKVLAA